MLTGTSVGCPLPLHRRPTVFCRHRPYDGSARLIALILLQFWKVRSINWHASN